MHQRKTLRAKGIDFSEAAIYFVTISLNQRQPILGSDNEVGPFSPSAIGKMCEDDWGGIPVQFPDVQLDSFVVMTDHVHGLFATGCEPDLDVVSSYSDVLRWYKCVTTARYSSGVHEQGWPRYHNRLWQRGSYDHVVRNEADLVEKRRYIVSNPWALASKLVDQG